MTTLYSFHNLDRALACFESLCKSTLLERGISFGETMMPAKVLINRLFRAQCLLKLIATHPILYKLQQNTGKNPRGGEEAL